MENNQNNAAPVTAHNVPSLGRMLRDARESQGLSVADVTSQIKLAPRQIEALEADDFKSLPEKAFLRGFVRSYAKLLQLDAQPLLDALPDGAPVQEHAMRASVEVPFPTLQSARVQNFVWYGAAALVGLIAVGFALWSVDTPRKVAVQDEVKSSTVEVPVVLPETVEVVAASPVQQVDVVQPETTRNAKPEQTPVKPSKKPVKPAEVAVVKSPAVVAKVEGSAAAHPDAPVSQVEPVKSGNIVSDDSALIPPSKLRLVFGEESWTEIKDRDGNILSSKLHASGSEFNIEGRAPFSMLIGHAHSVSLYHRGKQVDLAPHINATSEVAHVTVK